PGVALRAAASRLIAVSMTDPRTDASVDDLDDLDLFVEFATTRQRSIRNRLVERHMGLAAHIAKRFSRSGGTEDDLRQVAMLGLVKAVDRFDPEFGVPFAAFAGSTIEGELKRHFRDHSWAVRVPRSAKELHLLVRRAADELVQSSGRSPSVDEIAASLGIDRDDVLRGLSVSAAARVSSLNSGGGDGSSDTPLDRIGALATEEVGFEHAMQSDIVERLLTRLPERERTIVKLRFYDQLSQAEIAAQVGVSQMQVSRLLRASFERMRGWLNSEIGDSEDS
ncbi:MAG TPA: SigB/SigF/SigG family RNA polymerase sigma factor, partial [Ilumatobacteraceae bacterium]|nr:SigB/SigF/SigG family RNA polymerase sigma factor [Ilumatobacteraceae bacterium]